MLRDFLRFLRHTLAIIRFISGVLLALLLLLLACGALFVVAEGLRAGEALYLVLITALKIGYGDISPATPLGRVVSMVTGLIGIVITGIVVAVVVRALSLAIEEKRREQDPLPWRRFPRKRMSTCLTTLRLPFLQASCSPTELSPSD